ncbi:MAG: endolytic transglycosylase MltG [Proteobacteria bacterium]|nr:endolytic transglycosylase MltG [Pseudomonadota bacterium]
MRTLLRLLAVLLVVALLAAGSVWWWLERPLPLAAERVEVSIEPGTSPREVARLWTAAGVQVPTEWLYQWFRWSGQARAIRAGSYEIEPGVTARTLLARMVRGDQTLEQVRFIDGWTLAQARAALKDAPHLRPATAALTEAELATALGVEGPLEGRFYPDTYLYSRGVSDLTVLKRALTLMDQRLATAWAGRDPQLRVGSPQELLVLASVVEKETGSDTDRPMVAGVFANRLRLGMPLQSDPTVIYGLGAAFDGNLRRADLLADTPWNTYTRRGLPPTPIALVGTRALAATARPAQTSALYFVARGDGSSVFSDTLADHNRAVNRHQRNQP